MPDTLNIFGVEYQNVTGIIASDDNGNELTYTRGGGDGDNMSFGAEPLVGYAIVGQSALCEEE